MRPMSDINIGDQYQRNYHFDLIWSVLEIESKERMVKIQAYNSKTMNEVLKPIWKKNTDSIFSKRIFNGKSNECEF